MLSIIIPTFERPKILRATLNELVSSAKEINCEILVINNSNNPLDGFEDYKAEVKFLQNEKKGAACARNYGFSRCSGDFVLFMDDDMIVSGIVINRIMSCLNHSDKSIYLPNWVYPQVLRNGLDKTQFGRFLEHINYISLEGWINEECNWEDELMSISGMASYFFMISRQHYLEVGGYDENFTFAGYEDHDMSSRLSNIGFKFFVLPDIFVFHNESDRVRLMPWLKRKRRNAKTQKQAFELGYKDVQLKNRLSFLKSKQLILLIEKILLIMRFMIPNHRRFDFIYFKLIGFLVAVNINLGYNYD